MSDLMCTRCGRAGHRASHCHWPSIAPLQACMGGWCRIRARCPHHTEAARGPQDADRLCLPGLDGQGADIPIRITRPAGTWERGGAGLLAQASPFPEVA